MTTHTSKAPVAACLTLAIAIATFGPAATQAQTISTMEPTLGSDMPGWIILPTAPWTTVADMLVAEASRRGPNTDSVELIRCAAAIRYQTGHGPEALILLARAGTIAAEAGHPLLAAHTYLDGAWMAFELNRLADAGALADGAFVIADSGVLSRASAEAVRDRALVSEVMVRIASID